MIFKVLPEPYLLKYLSKLILRNWFALGSFHSQFRLKESMHEIVWSSWKENYPGPEWPIDEASQQTMHCFKKNEQLLSNRNT